MYLRKSYADRALGYLAYKCKFCLEVLFVSHFSILTECNFQDIRLKSNYYNVLILLSAFNCFAENQLKRLNTCTNLEDFQLKCVFVWYGPMWMGIKQANNIRT